MPIKITRSDAEVDKIRDVCNEKKAAGCRLAHIMCQMNNGFELIYCFDNQGATENVYVHPAADQEVESVSDIYAFSFLYENEIKELFGVKYVNMSLDFGGNLYQTSVKRAFNPENGDAGEAAPAAKPAAKANKSAPGGDSK